MKKRDFFGDPRRPLLLFLQELGGEIGALQPHLLHVTWGPRILLDLKDVPDEGFKSTSQAT